MSQHYQTTQQGTQYILANIMAQGTSNITDYYNIQYVPATNSDFEVQSSDSGYKYKQGTETVDVTSTGTVYYKNITSTTKITSISQYNKCSIVACSGGGGGGGGGGSGFEADKSTVFQPSKGNIKSGADGGDGGRGIVAVYTGIDLTPYSYITVNLDSGGAGGAGGISSGQHNSGQNDSKNGQDGTDGQDGSDVKIIGTKSNGANSTILIAYGGYAGKGGTGGKGNGAGTAGQDGDDGSVTAPVGTSSAITQFATSLKVYTYSAQHQTSQYGTAGNRGQGSDESDAGDTNGNDGDSGGGAFARIYFYK